MSDFDLQRLRQKIADVGAILLQASQTGRVLNEADTERIIVDPLLEALGYSPLEITKRQHDAVTGTVPDYTVLDATTHRWFLEAKRLDLPLQDKEAMQAVLYASSQGAAWAVLTNGRAWYFYLAHLQKPLNEKRVFQIDDLFTDPARAADTLQLLSQASMTNDGLSNAWNARQTQAKLLSVVRREFSTPHSTTRKTLRKVASVETGAVLSDADIGNALQSLFGTSVLEPAPLSSVPAPKPAAPNVRKNALVSPVPEVSALTHSPSTDLPTGDWKTLEDLLRDYSLTTGRKPVRVLLGGSEIKLVRYWSEAAQAIMQFLGDTYGLPSLPYTLSGKGKKYLLNREPIRPDGKTMIASAKIVVSGETVYVDTHESANAMVHLLLGFAKARNAPLSAVHIEVSPRSENEND